MIKKKKLLLLSIALIIIIILLIYRYYILNYTSTGILKNVINREGYSLHLKTEQVPIQLFIKPDWISFSPNERKELNIQLLELHNTRILLDNVWNRGNDIYFSFTTAFSLDYKKGEFLYNGFFNEDGTYTTPSGEIILYDKDWNKISAGQTGTGPNAAFSFGIEPEVQKSIRDGFYVKYTGFNLYDYLKK